MSKGEEVCKEVLNLVYTNGLGGIDEDKLPRLFGDCFGAAVYNTGDKEEGIGISGILYNNESPDKDFVSEAVEIMESSYDELDEFRSDFIIAYGLTDINNAKVGNMGKVLGTFSDTTGECVNEIEKIETTSGTIQNKIYAYMVDELDAKAVKKVDELEDLLDRAYKSAVNNNSGGGGNGGGGLSAGSGNNRKPVSGTSVGGAVGSGIPDEAPVVQSVFTDITDAHWAYDSVVYLKNKGIVSGTETGAFEPDRLITREEFTKMIILACGIYADDEVVYFTDVEKNAWYVPYIGAAVDRGIVKGISSDEFGIGMNITRQDMSVMVKRALDASEKEISVKREYIDFADNKEIADYALSAIKMLYEAEIINGKGNNLFEPIGNATRAEAAKIIYEAFK